MSALGPTTGVKTRKAQYQQMLFRFAPDSRPTSRSQNYSRRQLFANAAIAAAEHGLLGCGVYDPTDVVSRGVDHDGNLRQPSGAGLAPIDREADPL
jgi:hypothetical protein